MKTLRLKQYLKMFMQNALLPFFYRVGRRKKVQPGLVVFADSHHNDIPYSMEDLYQWFLNSDYQVVSMVRDCDGGHYLGGLYFMIRFMLLYARAQYVFICDTFLPVASCRKRPETTVVQMWHAAGILKKYGYDAKRDIPAYYKGEVYRNYSVIITSGEACNRAYVSGMHANPKTVKALGLSRTDRFFKESYVKTCLQRFYEQYPECKGRKIALWAPTFRGNAAAPRSLEPELAQRLERKLGDEWCVIMKLHPHMERYNEKQQCRLSTEQLLPVADVLISDYSSVIFDYLILEKPLVLYAPDLKEFEDRDQLYIDYHELPGTVVQTEKELAQAVLHEYKNASVEKIAKFRKAYMEACDGNAMEHLIEYLGL